MRLSPCSKTHNAMLQNAQQIYRHAKRAVNAVATMALQLQVSSPLLRVLELSLWSKELSSCLQKQESDDPVAVNKLDNAPGYVLGCPYDKLHLMHHKCRP